jgi:hypothetical protein
MLHQEIASVMASPAEGKLEREEGWIRQGVAEACRPPSRKAQDKCNAGVDGSEEAVQASYLGDAAKACR